MKGAARQRTPPTMSLPPTRLTASLTPRRATLWLCLAPPRSAAVSCLFGPKKKRLLSAQALVNLGVSDRQGIDSEDAECVSRVCVCGRVPCSRPLPLLGPPSLLFPQVKQDRAGYTNYAPTSAPGSRAAGGWSPRQGPCLRGRNRERDFTQFN